MSKELGLKPITDELLRTNDNLVLTTPNSGGGVLAYALRVIKETRFSREYTKMSSISSGNTVELDLLGVDGHGDQTSSPGDSIFELPDTKVPHRILHFSGAWMPDGVKIWQGYPHDTVVQGMYSSTRIDVGDTVGYEWSDNTRLDNRMPSTAFETIKVPGNLVYFGFENARTDSVLMKAWFYGKAYDVAVINAIDENKAMDIVKGKYPRTIKSVGALDNFTLSTPDEWGKPLQLNRNESAMLGIGD